MNQQRAITWVKQHWILSVFILLVLLPGLGFILGSGAILIYIYWPESYSKLAIAPIHTNTQHITLIAHGLRDNATSWSDPLKQRLQQHPVSQQIPTTIISLDWSAYANGAFRCSVHGKRIGHMLGEKISALPQLQSAHLIGHSCGSFVVLGLCESLKTSHHNTLVHTTYLDPVSIYGGLFWNYGIERFGSCANFAEAYIDHEDSVPGSNQALPNTYTFDVTLARKNANATSSPHLWPIVYYQSLVEKGIYPNLQNSDDLSTLFPAGKMQYVSKIK